MIRAVVFDLDGVIRHFDAGYVVDIERRYELAPGSVNTAAFTPSLLGQVTAGHISRAEWIAEIGAAVGSLAAATEWGLQPCQVDGTVLALSDDLRSHGVVVAVLTNGTDTIPDEVDSLGITARVDSVFNSASIGFAKPDPRAFQHVLAALSLNGQDVFFTDDSPGHLVGAAGLGMSTHHFHDLPHLREALSAAGVPGLR